jgi:hypothetical protein
MVQVHSACLIPSETNYKDEPEILLIMSAMDEFMYLESFKI